MATTTRTRTTRTRTPKAKATPEVEAPETPEVEETPEAEAPAEPKAKAVPAYRTAEGFNEAVKSLRSLAKGNPALRSIVQLITHLAWRTPQGSVGWAKGTTADVVSTADDLAIGTGTPLPQAMDVALSAAEKEVGEEQRDAFDALAGIVRAHAA